MSIRQVHQKSELFATSGSFQIKGLRFNHGCHDELMMSMNLSDFAILNIHGVGYCCINNGIGKSKAINLIQNADLSEKT